VPRSDAQTRQLHGAAHATMHARAVLLMHPESTSLVTTVAAIPLLDSPGSKPVLYARRKAARRRSSPLAVMSGSVRFHP